MKLLLTLIITLFQILVFAEITTDGTLGDVVNLDGPDYLITEEIGQTAGDNLFHSFLDFDLTAEESATFTGSDNISNIIARITGGKSSIDGQINCDIDGANLFLLNQAGILFGKNATLNLSGSFHASTADYLQFSDTENFYSKPINGGIITAAAPESFGFLGNNGSITVDGSQLFLAPEEALSFAANGIELKNSTLVEAEQGTITLCSLSEGKCGLTVEDDIVSSENVIIKEDTILSISGAGGGELYIEGGDIFIDASKLEVITSGDSDGGCLVIEGETLEASGQSFITTETKWDGNGADIEIALSDMSLSEGSTILAVTSGRNKSGNSGNINIFATDITLDDSDIWSKSTRSTGVTGEVNIDAVNLRLLNSSTIVNAKLGMGFGKNGSINLNVENELFLSDSTVASETVIGMVEGADVNITAKKLTMENRAAIYSLSRASADAGTLTINSQRVDILSGSAISTSALSSGRGGDCFLTVDGDLRIDGFYVLGGTVYNSEIASRSVKSGDGGDVQINAKTVKVTNGAEITTASESASNPGAAGNILINSESLLLVDAKITAESTGSTGGHIELTTEDETVLIDSAISTKVFHGIGDAGDIDLNSEVLVMNDSVIRSDAFGGDGGNIHVDSELIMQDYESYFDASSELGVSGTIAFTAPQVYLNEEVEELKTEFLPAEEWVFDSARARLGNSSSFVIVPDSYKASKKTEFYSVPLKIERSSENVPQELNELLGF